VGSACDLLLVAAFAPELVGLEGLLGERMQAEVGGLSVVALPVGIGLVSAATGAAGRVEALKPRATVLLGTCGAYPGATLAVAEVVVAGSVALVDAAVVEGKAALPEPMSARILPHAALTAALGASGARRVVVATTLGLTTDDALAARIERTTGAEVEHLEAFAVGTACAGLDVPFAAVLGAANVVGAGGRTQWRSEHRRAGEAAAAFVARWVQAGAAGVPHRS
jgi:nucleoside phosphorylase